MLQIWYGREKEKVYDFSAKEGKNATPVKFYGDILPLGRGMTNTPMAVRKESTVAEKESAAAKKGSIVAKTESTVMKESTFDRGSVCR